MRVVIFGNGEAPETREITAQVSKQDIIICADGGAKHALALRLPICAVVGDFDSLDSESLVELERTQVELKRYPKEKDCTDLELAMRYSIGLGATELFLVACLGGQLDHLLCNLQLFASAEFSNVRIRILDHSPGGAVAEIVHAPKTLMLYGEVGARFSLLPLTSEMLIAELSGMKWPLKNRLIKQGQTLGISNQFLERQGRLVLETGVAMVFCAGAPYLISSAKL